jgi:hypothetical protein
MPADRRRYDRFRVTTAGTGACIPALLAPEQPEHDFKPDGAAFRFDFGASCRATFAAPLSVFAISQAEGRRDRLAERRALARRCRALVRATITRSPRPE